MRKYIGGLIIGISLAGAVSVGQAQEVLKVSFNASLESTWDAGAQKFKSLVEERTKNKYKVEIYPSAMLANGNDRVEVEMTQAGVIDIVLKSSVWLTQFDKKFMAVSLPFVFRSEAEVLKALDGGVSNTYNDILDKVGLVSLGWGLGGSFELCTKSRAVATAADIGGLKIRMPSIPIFVSAYSALQAVPVTMSFAEAFTALQTGTVDADTCGISLLYSSRFYEAVKHISITGFAFEPIGMLMNKSRLAAMSDEDRAIITSAAAEAMSFQQEFHIAEEKRILEKLPSLGMTVTKPTAEEIDRMKSAVAEVVKGYSADVGEEFLASVLAAKDR